MALEFLNDMQTKRGAGIGGLVAGPVGALVGGMWGNKTSARDKALEDVNAIPEVDPMQLDFLDQLVKEKRAVESGFTTDFQVATDLQQQALAGGLSVAESVGATNPALAISMMDKATQGYNTGINQSLGTISTRGLGMMASIGDLINRITQRKLDVTTYKAAQKLGMATDDLKTFKENVFEIGASIPNMVSGLPTMATGGGNTPVAGEQVVEEDLIVEPWMTTPMWQ